MQALYLKEQILSKYESMIYNDKMLSCVSIPLIWYVNQILSISFSLTSISNIINTCNRLLTDMIYINLYL